MISELLALAAGGFLGVVSTAHLYRNDQSANSRKAIASVLRYLDTDSLEPLGKTTDKLKFYLGLINEADDLVANSNWAQKERHRFLSEAVRLAAMRRKGVRKQHIQHMEQLAKSRQQLRLTGQRLTGYFDFPSRLWLKAALSRLRHLTTWPSTRALKPKNS